MVSMVSKTASRCGVKTMSMKYQTVDQMMSLHDQTGDQTMFLQHQTGDPLLELIEICLRRVPSGLRPEEQFLLSSVSKAVPGKGGPLSTQVCNVYH